MTKTLFTHMGWRLGFERDGTEDVAILCDAEGKELARSRRFWLPQAEGPIPETLAAMRLMCAAPALLAALESLLPYAENEAFTLAHLKDHSEAEAEANRASKTVEAAHAAIAAATDANLPWEFNEPDVHALLARRRQIAVVWSVEDVREIRPDLSDEQAWDVLQSAEDGHDATVGISWDVLACHAESLFGDASDETDDAEEA